jgi:VWFA-related protein
MLHRISLAFFFCGLFLALAQQSPAQSDSGAQPQTAPVRSDPQLKPRPPAEPEAKKTVAGRIHLDLLVTDPSGKPVSGLERKDFALLDDHQEQKILSFRAVDGTGDGATLQQKEPPVQVILLIDTVNLPFDQVAFTREQVEKYLRQNSGHLAQPTSVFLLTDAGLQVQPRPSVDGNGLATLVNQIQPRLHTIRSSQGADSELERFRLSVRQLLSIAENNATKPGRKLLIWVGPGWPMLESANFQFSAKDQAGYFHLITELSTRLREARIALYSVSAVTFGTRAFSYQAYLKGVKSASHADTGNLALKVLAEQSGGRVVNPDNDLAGQINNCIADAGTYYTLSFDPPKAEHVDEYHELKVQIDKPGLKVQTSTAYYDQP